VLQAETPEILVSDADGAPVEGSVPAAVQGGRERGLILHKLFEEVLTGEIAEATAALVARAENLIRALGRPVMDDPAQGLAPAELAGCVTRALALPEIAALRPGLMPEFPVYASALTEAQEEATAGVADAIHFGPDGAPQVVVDWKSDVDPAPETVEHYRAQVRAYLDMTETECGLIVMATSGVVIPVVRAATAAAAA
jgi:exodeoxyribonuclease-5